MRYEYRHLDIRRAQNDWQAEREDGHEVINSEAVEYSLKSRLEALGRDGWELVASFGIPPTIVNTESYSRVGGFPLAKATLIFKRPVETTGQN